MTLHQILQQEIKDSELWLSREKDESIYKRDLKKRIELMNWVLQNMKNPNVEICSLIESKMNETIQEIKKLDSIFESDILDSELRILDWIFYQVCKDQQKTLATIYNSTDQQIRRMSKKTIEVDSEMIDRSLEDLSKLILRLDENPKKTRKRRT